MEFVVVITYPEGQQQQVLVRAANRAAAEQAAARRYGSAGASVIATDGSQFSSQYLDQIRQSGAYLDATATGPTQPGPEDPGSQNPPGQSPAPAPQPPSGGFPPAPPSEYLPTDTETGQYGAFIRGLGQRGATTRGIAGQSNLAQSTPYESLYNARVALGDVPAGSGDTQYQNFVAGNANPYAGSLEALRSLRSAGPGGESLPRQQYFAPNESQMGDVRNLFNAALQGQYGGAAANFLQRFIPQAGAGFAAQAGPQNQDYLDYLRRSLGATSLFGAPQFGGGQTQGAGATRSF